MQREAAGLTWPQVDLDTGELTVWQQLQEHSGQTVLLLTQSVRTVALDGSTVATLRAHRARQRREHRVDRPDRFVFARPGGRPYSPGSLTTADGALRRERAPGEHVRAARAGARGARPGLSTVDDTGA